MMDDWHDPDESGYHRRMETEASVVTRPAWMADAPAEVTEDAYMEALHEILSREGRLRPSPTVSNDEMARRMGVDLDA